MRRRASALVLALALAAMPVLGVLCQMDCGLPPMVRACHQLMASDGGPTAGAAGHTCTHDHISATLALLASSTARDTRAASVAVPVSALARATVPNVRPTITGTHGPPGLNADSTLPRLTALRI